MIRRARVSLNKANAGKLEALHTFMLEAQRVVREYIDILWVSKQMHGRFVNIKVDTWLSARMQQNLGKQALEIVKSQRKRKTRTKPQFNRLTFNLDSRFVDIKATGNSFDLWVKLGSLGNKLSIRLPFNRHRHFNRFAGWTQSKSARISCVRGEYYLDVFFEKDAPEKKTTGKRIAVDIGYKKLLVTSENQRAGDDSIYEKIARKQQGSKAFKRALVERDEAINTACKQIMSGDVSVLYAENLKSVKTGSKGKLRKRFNNKLQRWSYSKVLSRLSMLCEEMGVTMILVPPAYTSQRCSKCGVICKSNREGGNYRCACGNSMDADYNAALNILHMGEYGPHAFNPIPLYSSG